MFNSILLIYQLCCLVDTLNNKCNINNENIQEPSKLIGIGNESYDKTNCKIILNFKVVI